jgi:hypothetical protein
MSDLPESRRDWAIYMHALSAASRDCAKPCPGNSLPTTKRRQRAAPSGRTIILTRRKFGTTLVAGAPLATSAQQVRPQARRQAHDRRRPGAFLESKFAGLGLGSRCHPVRHLARSEKGPAAVVFEPARLASGRDPHFDDIEGFKPRRGFAFEKNPAKWAHPLRGSVIRPRGGS